MSEWTRWKEQRIREQIYLQDLKHTKTSPNGTGVDWAGIQGRGGTSMLCFRQIVGKRSDGRIRNRGKKKQLTWTLLGVALLAAGVAMCAWVYLGQFGIDR